MDRCKMFSKLAKTDELFKELLDKFYVEYYYLYGAIESTGHINSTKINYLENNNTKLKVAISFAKRNKKFISKVVEFLMKHFTGNFSIRNEDNQLLITFRKDEFYAA